MKAIIYARVSTEDGRQNTDNQLDLLRTYAAQYGHEIDKEFVDHASGGTGDREAFSAMWKYLTLSAKSKCLVLFFSLDRLSREGVSKTLSYLETLEKLGHDYMSYSEQWLSSLGPFKDVVIALMATLAKQEKIKISERTKAGLARVRRSGSRSGKAIGRPKVEFPVEEAKAMRLTGSSASQIAIALGFPKTTVRRYLV